MHIFISKMLHRVPGFCRLTDPCHISSVPEAQVLLQSLMVKANLLSPLEQEKSALLHNSVSPLLNPHFLLHTLTKTNYFVNETFLSFQVEELEKCFIFPTKLMSPFE